MDAVAAQCRQARPGVSENLTPRGAGISARLDLAGLYRPGAARRLERRVRGGTDLPSRPGENGNTRQGALPCAGTAVGKSAGLKYQAACLYADWRSAGIPALDRIRPAWARKSGSSTASLSPSSNRPCGAIVSARRARMRSEEHTSELQSHSF